MSSYLLLASSFLRITNKKYRIFFLNNTVFLAI
nr:MAG TPA_asm: hypothetical protein [Caudoviricetes sp.]